MKGYHDIVGDGGSRVLEQVAEQRTRITDGLAGVRHLVAVGSGKGGVGKSTLTLHLAGALRARGLRIAILDADFNGPSQARMAGVQGALFVPGSHKVALPRTSERDRGLLDGLADPGVGGARVRERGARRVAYVARHEGVRAPRRDPRVLRVGSARSADVRSAAGSRADRPVRRFSRAADLVRARDDPVRGVAGRGRALGGRAVEGTQSRPRLRREHERLLLPRLQRDQAALRSLVPSLAQAGAWPGDPLPRDRSLRSRAGAALRSGDPSRGPARHTRWPGPGPRGAATSGQPRRSLPDEVPVRPLRQPDEAADRRPARARLAVGRLLVSGVRLRDGDADQCVRNTGRPVTRRADRPRDRPEQASSRGVATAPAMPVHRDDAATEWTARRGTDRAPGRPASRSPSGGRPPRKRGSRTFPSSSAPWRGPASRDSPGSEGPSKWTRRSSTRPATSSACERISPNSEPHPSRDLP